jgi:hypothetical protein
MADDIVAYRNKNTGQVVALTAEDARLEKLSEWERTDASDVTYSVADAHDRASAERASIEAAAALRLDSAAGSAIAGVAAAAAYNTGQGAGAGQTPAPLPTMSTGAAGEIQQPVSLLDKHDELRETGATPFEENKRMAQEEIANPPSDGVLKRAKADQAKGRTQIGPNPEEHAGPRARAKAASSTSATSSTDAAGGSGTNPSQPKREREPRK